VVRREQEVQRTLYESAQARQLMGQLTETLNPYMTRIQEAGVPPLQMIGNLLNTEAGLATGSPVQRAQIVANLVRQYGVDIQALDSALAGAPIEPSPDTNIQHTVQSLLQRELAPFHQMMQTAQQRQQQAAMEAQEIANQETDAFGQDPKNEFFNDVRQEMADLIEVANRRGFALSLNQAYEQAVQLSPKVREVIQMRQQRQNAIGASSVARRARAASVSISGAPVNDNSGAPPEDLRGALEAAWEATTRR
jgi:hypothetical protein